MVGQTRPAYRDYPPYEWTAGRHGSRGHCSQPIRWMSSKSPSLKVPSISQMSSKSCPDFCLSSAALSILDWDKTRGNQLFNASLFELQWQWWMINNATDDLQSILSFPKGNPESRRKEDEGSEGKWICHGDPITARLSCIGALKYFSRQKNKRKQMQNAKCKIPCDPITLVTCWEVRVDHLVCIVIGWYQICSRMLR